jgi:integrase
MKHSDYPGASSFVVKGNTYWRFRKTGLKPVVLPGQPHTPAFDAAYQAAIEGRTVKKADVVKHPRAAHPASLNACWMKVKARPKFDKLDPLTRYQYTYLVEDFLTESIDGMKRGDGPVSDLRPRHIQDYLDRLSPSNSTVLRVVLKKMMKEAIRQEWIEYDPTYSTETVERDNDAGFKAWPPHYCALFEQRWPIGSTPRTAYELARWLGARRSDVALVRWDQMVTKIIDRVPVEGFEFVQFKGRNKKGAFAKFHPISPMLADALAPLDRSTGTVLVNRKGRPMKMASISQAMKQTWAPAAGIPRGFTLHGLRKAMGSMLADAGASLHESRDVLGHATYKEVANYNKGRDQAISATRGNRAIVKLVRG